MSLEQRLRAPIVRHAHLVVGVDEERGVEAGCCQVVQHLGRVRGIWRVIK